MNFDRCDNWKVDYESQWLGGGSTYNWFSVNVSHGAITKIHKKHYLSDPLKQALVSTDPIKDDEELANLVAMLDAQTSLPNDCVHIEPLPINNLEIKVNIPSVVQPPNLELRPLPDHLRYAFLGNSNTLPTVFLLRKLYHTKREIVANFESAQTNSRMDHHWHLRHTCTRFSWRTNTNL